MEICKTETDGYKFFKLI